MRKRLQKIDLHSRHARKKVQKHIQRKPYRATQHSTTINDYLPLPDFADLNSANVKLIKKRKIKEK